MCGDNQGRVKAIIVSGNEIYQKLKNQIILLEYQPGAIMREKELMAAYGVSRTPIREAFMRLEMDGLVRIVPNMGTFVEDVSFQQLKDVFETRAYLVRLDKRSLIKLDGEIHKIINKSTKNMVLIKMLSTLHDQAVRIWTFSGAEGDYWDDLEKEFAEIVAALERHDEEMTAGLLEKHTKRFVEHVRSQLSF